MKAKTTHRRNSLLAAGLGSAGAAAAIVTAGKAVKKPAEAEAPAAPQQTAYRETDHIRKYYKTRKV